VREAGSVAATKALLLTSLSMFDGYRTWTVPDNVKLGEYTVAARSIAHSKKVSFIDILG
jgi:hypothetical protein